MIARLVLVAGLSQAALACTDYPDAAAPHGNPYDFLKPPPPSIPTGSDLTTWHEDVRPLVERHCLGCHDDGGLAGRSFATYQDTEPFRNAMVDYVAAARMPLWPWDRDCHNIANERRLSTDEREVFEAWRKDGFLPGAAADFVPLPPIEREPVGTVEVRLDAPSYAPAAGETRCFEAARGVVAGALDPLDGGEQDARGWWVTDVRIESETPGLVQSATLYLIMPGASVPEPGGAEVGYACAFGAGTSDERALVTWVPAGIVPFTLPDQVALLAPFGARFVVRVSYRQDLQAGTSGAMRAALWRYEGARTPAEQVRLIEVSPAAGEAVGQWLPAKGRLLAVTPELSGNGGSLELEYLTVIRQGGAVNHLGTCQARTTAWDARLPETLVMLGGSQTNMLLGNKLALGCEGLGAGERCRVTAMVAMPLYDDPKQLNGQTCSGVAGDEEQCLESCREASGCLLNCLAWEEPACGDCARAQLFSESCAVKLGDGQVAPPAWDLFRACEAASCAAETGFSGWLPCLLERCFDALNGMAEALGPALEDGRCNLPDNGCVYVTP